MGLLTRAVKVQKVENTARDAKSQGLLSKASSLTRYPSPPVVETIEPEVGLPPTLQGLRRRAAWHAPKAGLAGRARAYLEQAGGQEK